MPNSRLRCKSCKEYFRREEFEVLGFHSRECQAAWRCRQIVKKPSQPRKAKKLGNEFSAEFDQMRPLVHARSKGKCEARIPGVCTFKASHIHHRKLRSQGGTNDLENLRDLCLSCHRVIHDNPEWAQQVGLIVLGRDDSSEIAVDLRRYITPSFVSIQKDEVAA
jgi:hypothetical protein